MHTPPPPLPAPRARWRRVLVWVCGLGLMAALLHQVPPETVLQAWSAAPLAVWAGTCAALGLSYVWRAARLQVVLGLDTPPQSTDLAPHRALPRRLLGLRWDALRVILLHNAAVNVLPMRAGELSFPWLAARQLGMPMSSSLASLLWMRLQDLAVLLALGLLMWPGLPLSWRVAGLALLVAGWQAALWVLRRLPASQEADTAQAVQTTDRGANLSPAPTWQQRARQLARRLQGAMLEPRHHGALTWLFTWANWLTKLSAGAWLLGHLTQRSWQVGWAGALGGELAAVVPIQGPAGFGTYEAGVWAGYTLHAGVSAPQTALIVPAALALHLCMLLCSVLAAALVGWLPEPHAPAAPTARIPD